MLKKKIHSVSILWLINAGISVFSSDIASLEDNDIQLNIPVSSKSFDDTSKKDVTVPKDNFETLETNFNSKKNIKSGKEENLSVLISETKDVKHLSASIYPQNKNENLPSNVNQGTSSDKSMASFFPSNEKKKEKNSAKIKKITIMVDGKELEEVNSILSNIASREGDNFNQWIIDRDIRSLAALNRFEDISTSADRNGDGTFNLKFYLNSSPKIKSIEFPHEKITNKKLKQEIKTVSGKSFNKSFINDDIQTIYRYYQMQGFPKPNITYKIIPVDDPKYVKLIWDIVTGENFPISKIEFFNFNDVNTDKIKKEMLLQTRSLFSIFTKKGYFVEDFLRIDCEKIAEEMRNTGYLDGKITRAEFKIQKKKTGILEFEANLGKKYCLGKIEFEGNKIYSDDKIRSLLSTLKTGNTFSPGNITKAAERIQNFYNYNGYANTHVTTQQISTFIDDTIDVKFIIHESSLAYVNSISINGNYKTKNKVILRELTFAPGDKFNYIKIKNSENRLKNTDFFEDVTIDTNDSEISDRKNIQVNVKEKNTGKIQLGGAISAKNNQYVFFEISQSNFDLFGSQVKFQGSGQKARARAQIGTRENQLILHFEESFLFDRKLTFGVDVVGEKTKYRDSDSNYSGPTYDQTSIGFEPYFRKQIYELWEGRLAYNFTNKNIRNVSDKAVQPLKDEAGRRNSSRIKLSVERNTRDSFIFPRTGSFLSIDTQTAGFGGQTKLFKVSATASRWFTISEKYDHSLALIAKVGVICPFAHKKTPFTERYFLGGDTLMRGFEFREISPKIETKNAKGEITYGDSLGGNSFIYGCSEYTFNIFDDFYGAMFLEVGNVGVHQKAFEKNLNVDAGFGLRIFIMNMPLHLDWGYPVHCTDGIRKKGVQFNFSFGASF